MMFFDLEVKLLLSLFTHHLKVTKRRTFLIEMLKP